MDTELLTKKLIQTTGESLASLTYIFVSNSNKRNYIEIYDSKNTLINLNQICPECLKLDFNIGSNLTNTINNKEIPIDVIVTGTGIGEEDEISGTESKRSKCIHRRSGPRQHRPRLYGARGGL